MSLPSWPTHSSTSGCAICSARRPGDEALLRRAGVHVADAAAVVDDRSAIADALTRGAGLGLLPPFLGEPGGEAPVVTMPVHAVFHGSQRDDVRVRVLVEEIEAWLQSTL